MSTQPPTPADAPVQDVGAELAQARELAEQRRLRRAYAPWTSMVLSLGVVVGIVLLLVALVPRVNGISQPPVNVPLGARAAAAQVDFPPAQPQGLPQQWQPTSVRTTRGYLGVMTWHVGYTLSGGQYAAVEQGSDVPVRWVIQQTAVGAADGEQEVAGVTWKRYVAGRGNHNSLVHASGRVTTVVTGTVGFDQLAVLAASLQPAG